MFRSDMKKIEKRCYHLRSDLRHGEKCEIKKNWGQSAGQKSCFRFFFLKDIYFKKKIVTFDMRMLLITLLCPMLELTIHKAI